MKVLLSGAFRWCDRRVGFGNASYFAYKSLKSLGVDAHLRPPDNDDRMEADIEICFDYPDRYDFVTDGYKIGYTPWESTDVHQSYYEGFDKCDEIWVTSNWSKKIFESKIPDKKIFTYMHGINSAYVPKKRKINPSEPFTFLFIGEPAFRKNGQMVADTFAELFGNNPNYRLILKGSGGSNIQLKSKSMPGLLAPPDLFCNNIIVNTEWINQSQLIQLYEMTDVFVYPTWGEGFGFNPLQAMAMGIPTISTYEWADYKKYITVPIATTLEPSPWPEHHPGYMHKPNAEQFEKAMEEAKENYDYLSDIAFRNAFKIHQDFNWMTVTRPAYGRLKKIFKTLQLEKAA